MYLFFLKTKQAFKKYTRKYINRVYQYDNPVFEVIDVTTIRVTIRPELEGFITKRTYKRLAKIVFILDIHFIYCEVLSEKGGILHASSFSVDEFFKYLKKEYLS